jgi:hypothetical protein
VIYDIVGDIHGQAKELKGLLRVLGYNCESGVWKHPIKKVIFLGDFIDRGNLQKETIGIVRPMIESGSAYTVMGNHEYNAICYHTKDESGNYLRKHTIKNQGHHQAFMDEYDGDLDGLNEVITWFKTLPLWLEFDEFRVIHACWNDSLIHKIKASQGGSNLLSDTLLFNSAKKGAWEHDAVEIILKGMEIPLPNGVSFEDADGNKRTDIRIKWWDMMPSSTYRGLFIGSPKVRDILPEDIIGLEPHTYGETSKPLFIGHYWMTGETQLLADNIVCLDYSVAKNNGKLVSYAFESGEPLSNGNFSVVERFAD